MKVTNNNSNASVANLDKARKTADKLGLSKAASGSQTVGQDKLNVSGRAQEIAKAKELATPNMGVDEAKVARLQNMIDSGKYKVDAGAVADRLIAEHATLKD